jgi:hypothetical protein
LRVDPYGDDRFERALPMAQPGEDGQDD